MPIMTDAKEKIENNIYEIGYLLDSRIADDKILKEVANIKSILEKNDCVFLSGDEPKLKELEYSISKVVAGEKQIYDKAYFAWMKFKVAKENMTNLKIDLDKYENIVRYLFINTVEKDSLISNSKKFNFTRMGKGKEIDETKIVKPVKIVKKETKTETETEIKKETEKETDAEQVETKTETKIDESKAEQQLDETIDKLIIK